MRELKKIYQMEKLNEQMKLSIDDIRNDQIENEDCVKLDKHSNIFELIGPR